MVNPDAGPLNHATDVPRSDGASGRPLLKGFTQGFAFAVVCLSALLLFKHEWRIARVIALGPAVAGTAAQYHAGARSAVGWLVGLAAGCAFAAALVLVWFILAVVNSHMGP